MASIRYRYDIDGLRALAVVPVVWYHLGLPGLPGGFTGVDVFFVISGFLITSLLRSDMEQGKYSLLRFYERRARRIFPALATMLMACVAMALLIMLPQDAKNFGANLAMTSLFSANLYLMFTSGYFDADASLNPLLHMWSLGVEEQFYVFFPLFLWLVHRLGFWRWLVPLIGLGLVASLSLGVWMTYAHPTAAFYLLLTRAWEMLAGALLACWAVPSPKNRITREGLGWAGLALVVLGYLYVSKENAFPGILAALPVMGAALIIFSHGGGATALSRVLAIAPVRGLGLISYSLYLWHWPVIVFYKYISGHELDLAVAFILGAVSIVLAWISWRWVEQPWRNGKTLVCEIWVVSGIGLMVLVGLGGALYAAKGWPERVPAEVIAVDNFRYDFSQKRHACHRDDHSTLPIGDSCIYGAEGVLPSLMVWGDSHGVELADALGDMLGTQGSALMTVTSSQCPPALGFETVARPRCATHNANVLAYIKSAPHIRTVVLPMYHLYYHQGPYAALYTQGVRDSVLALRMLGVRVVVVGPTPDFALPVPLMAAADLWWQRPFEMQQIKVFHARSAEIENNLTLLATETGAVVVWPEKAICQATGCPMLMAGHPLYFDRNHLSMHGAGLLVAYGRRVGAW